MERMGNIVRDCSIDQPRIVHLCGHLRYLAGLEAMETEATMAAKNAHCDLFVHRRYFPVVGAEPFGVRSMGFPAQQFRI